MIFIDKYWILSNEFHLKLYIIILLSSYLENHVLICYYCFLFKIIVVINVVDFFIITVLPTLNRILDSICINYFISVLMTNNYYFY